MNNKKKLEHLIPIVILISLFLLPFLWSSQNLYNLGGDDSRLYFYTPSNWLKNIAFYSWSGYFGSHTPQQAYIPLNIFSIVLQYLFPFLNLQKMLYGLILSLGFLITFLTLKELLNTKEKASYYAAILGGLTYIFSPLVYYTQWAVPLGSILGVAGYPAIFFFFLKAIRQGKVKYLIYGSMISLVFSIAVSAVPWTFAFLIGMSIFLILYVILSKDQLRLIIKYGVIYVLLLISMNSLWFLPRFVSLISIQTHPQVSSALSTSFKVGSVHTVNAVAPYMNIFDTLLNLHSRGFLYQFGRQMAEIAKYTYRLTPLSIFLPIIIFFPLLLRKKKDNLNLRIWFSLVIAMLFLAYLQTVNIGRMGINLFNLFIRYLPGWVMFKNFYHKVPIAYVFFYSLTLGVSLYIISKSAFKESAKKAIFVIIFLVVILQALPFIRGKINNISRRPYTDTTRNVDIPPYYIEAVNTVDKLKEGKVLSLPLTFASWSFFSDKRNNGLYIGLSPILVFTGKNDFNGAFAFANGERFIPGLSSMVKEMMQNRDYESLGNLFVLFNLRYIFYNSEIYEDETLRKIGKHCMWGYNDFQTKDNIERLIREIPNKKIKKIGPISIYEISSK